MLPLKLVRSLVFGETINNNPLLLLPQIHDHPSDDAAAAADDDDDRHRQQRGKSRSPFLLFLPTGELVTDTYKLATIARDMGMDLHPTPSLSHIILSYPPPPPSPSSPSSSTTFPSSWSSSSLSSSASLPDDAVPLPFPCLSAAPISHLRAFVKLSKGLFKLVFAPKAAITSIIGGTETESNWNCSSMSLFSRLSGDRIDTMEGFSRALAGLGWTLFKTMDKKPAMGPSVVSYLFRKVDRRRFRACSGGPGGECRVRELRLPALDFRNAPLRILHYILLMTDDIFYLA